MIFFVFFAVLVFLSTPSARRATLCFRLLFFVWFISIHALREEGDALPGAVLPDRMKFLSTPSARRATLLQNLHQFAVDISIHALREEGDVNSLFEDDGKDISIHALREEGDPNSVAQLTAWLNISIHALLAEGDDAKRQLASFDELFLSTPSSRRATLVTLSTCSYTSHFYPRPPRGGRQQKRRKHPRF